MPLAERDVNSQHQHPHQHQLPLTRGKRLPTARHLDENSPPPPFSSLPKGTPTRQQRFLAPTTASNAKTTSTSNSTPSPVASRVQPRSSGSTPQSQTHSSKLPRRNAATPTLAPPISRWNLATHRTAYPEDSVYHAQTPPQGRETGQSLVAVEPASRLALHARAEKPLPSRPIASLVYGPSPSRHSRSLIDASEKPLRLSIAGSECDWPTLTPTLQPTPAQEDAPFFATTMSDAKLSSQRLSASPSSTLGSVAQANNDATDTQRTGSNVKIPGSPAHRHSSVSSFNSMAESIPASPSAGDAKASPRDNVTVTESPNSTTRMLPPRKSSLPIFNSAGKLAERSQSASANVDGSNGFTRDLPENSRPHSPSPASFSRPRPTSISHPPGVASLASAVAILPVRLQKAASRIPLPDQKKAALVDIKARRTSSIPMPKFEKGLSFGGRRIDSPDPLKVLDHGIKRRQLNRANTNGSNSTVSTVPTKFLSDSSPPIDRSKANTPDCTVESTTEDEEEVTTPSDKSLHFVKHGYKPKHVNTGSGSHYAGATLKVYDDAEVVLGRPPPSNSPYTAPLQTVPSQSMLPLRPDSDRGSVDESQQKVVVKPTEFSAFAQRLSALQGSQVLSTKRGEESSLVRSDSKSELVEILREAEYEDALISQSGATGLDIETKEEITRTLSLLEGKCGPVNTDIDMEHLARMFGKLKSGFEKAPKSAAFVEDATVAEKFLARQESTASEVARHIIPARANESVQTPPMSRKEGDTASQHSRSKTVASKWSDSTASARDRSYPYADAASSSKPFGVGINDLPLEGLPPGVPPKGPLDGNPTSIGYPSRTPGKAHRLLGTNERSVKTYNPTRRESSPTLGTRVPGSVRAAREKARDAAGSRATKTSTTKVEKMPTPNTKTFRVSGDPPRGRNPSAEKSSSNKLPRSRSKSRYVLEKLNGLFSGKRDRRNSDIPPVPPVKDSFDISKQSSSSADVRINSLGSPMVEGPRHPPLTKMPTLSPPVDGVAPAPRRAPSSASFSTSVMDIASDADYENRRSLQALAEKLLARAMQEADPAKKERLLTFAKVLSDSLIMVREAQISAETAQTAARSAQLSYEMTAKSAAMLQRLASSMNRR